MDKNDKMKHEAYKRDKKIKETTIEIQKNVDKIKEKVDKANKELKKDE